MPQSTPRQATPTQPAVSKRASTTFAQAHAKPAERPLFRLLRVYAFDPSLSTTLEYAAINDALIRVPWEPLEPGPTGEYLEVIDLDPASDCGYTPVDLNEQYLLAQNGLEPSEANPQFHQQMVYAVAMTTIRNFERALGRTAFWAPHFRTTQKEGQNHVDEEYVQRLRIYPHGLREANAYYSPQKHALLFGYFPAYASDPRHHLPGGLVFTCLSHDIVAHETTHALLDGMHRYFNEPSNPDVLAFHEAFADIVALFQHFTMPEVVRHQIAKTRGDLVLENLLFQLAQEFGQATESHAALRDALGEFGEDGTWKRKAIDPTEIERVFEPHQRGSLLVAAVFDAFVAIFKSRIADLLRIATNGTGVLPAGSLLPDLVERISGEARKSAQDVLTVCIRGLDYCPPVDLTFGEYLRALITADYDLFQEDALNYRAAFIEAFRQRGIYPRGLRSLSVENLRWSQPTRSDWHSFELPSIREIKKRMPEWNTSERNAEIYWKLSQCRAALHEKLQDIAQGDGRQGLKDLTNLDLALPFQVHSLRPARREGPGGGYQADWVIEIIQSRRAYLDEEIQKRADADPKGTAPREDFMFRGGCTLLVDLKTSEVRYCIYKHINSAERLARQRAFITGRADPSLRITYFGEHSEHEPFALLHRSISSAQEGAEWRLK